MTPQKNKLFKKAAVFFLGFFVAIVSSGFSGISKDQDSGLPPLTGSIKIHGRQLLINGVPFAMKGICYHPVRKGETIPDGLMTLNPTAADLLIIEQDFKMMHEAGVNTIRPYEPIVDSHILDLLVKYQLKTIVPLCANWKTRLFDFSETIDLLKNHPATLLWEIGNEWNYNLFYGQEEDKDHPKRTPVDFKCCVSSIKNIARYVRSQDPTHPVASVVGDLPKDLEPELKKLFRNLDLAGINVYDWLSFGDRFERWKSLTDKPLYLGEYGTDAYNQNIKAEDIKSQAFAERALISEVLNNLSAKNPNNVLVGGCLFEWNDEWWKDQKGSLSTHDTGGFKIDDHSGPYPDHFFTEEWWGIVDIDRKPRPAYDVVKELFTASSAAAAK